MSDVDSEDRSAGGVESDEHHDADALRTTAAYVHGSDGSPQPTPAGAFGRRGWLLLGMLFVAFFVVPALIYLRPPGVSFTFAYLVLPLVPATVLAVLAVWVATR